MNNPFESIRKIFTPSQPLSPGVYHYQAPPDAPFPYRLHLRIEGGGQGVLIVNASTVLHLNQTAAEYAYHLMQGDSDAGVARRIAARYNVDTSTARRDYLDFVERLNTLIDMPDLDPVTYLDFERQSPYTDITAPYRLDCALTYRLPDGNDPQAAPTKRVDRELTTVEWQTILDKAWEAGIPHIIFTGGEPTLRDDLFSLLRHVEETGQVTGLLSDGLRLADNDYFQELLQTGLDHLMIVLRPEMEQAWVALENVLPADLYTTVHLTITPENRAQAGALLERLKSMGANAVSLSASDLSLEMELMQARQLAADLELELVWDIPVPYSELNPVSLETDEDTLPKGSGRAWLYVEPDGDVLPAQGVNQVLGNLLQDPWIKIWEGK